MKKIWGLCVDMVTIKLQVNAPTEGGRTAF